MEGGVDKNILTIYNNGRKYGKRFPTTLFGQVK